MTETSLPVTVPARSSRRLRLLLIANSVALGGAEGQLVRLATGCAARGHAVTVATLLDEHGHQATLQAAGVELRHLDAPHWRAGPAALVRGIRLARELAPDAVIGFDFQATMAARLIGLLAGVPVVISSVRNEHLGGRGRGLLLRTSDRLSTVTTANAHGVADGLVARRLVHPARMRVVPNALDAEGLRRPPSTRARVRAELGVDDGEFLWLAITYLRPSKDLPSLLRAFAALPAAARPRLVIVGSGPLRAQLQAQAADLGIDDRVALLGERDDVPDLLAGADATVLASWAEGLPNAVMESLAAGVPVVATAVGGTPELLAAGGGLLVPPRDHPALAAAMARMMRRPATVRAAEARAAGDRLIEAYAPARALEAWLDLLDEHVEQAS